MSRQLELAVAEPLAGVDAHAEEDAAHIERAASETGRDGQATGIAFPVAYRL